MGDLLARMWPPDGTYYWGTVNAALIETLHIASLGTLLSLLLALPFGLLVANNLTPNLLVNLAARVVLVASRSVNSLVWALLFVALFGPGPLAGTLAIAFRSVGFVGKLLGEAIEQAQRAPIEALESAGAGWFARIGYGYWPQVKPAFWSVVLLRWDINVRESAVLGLVGAGGIGMALDTAMNLFQWNRVATVLLAVFAVVVLAEIAVTQVRQRAL
jgi:phosphonate transport system permease protein